MGFELDNCAYCDKEYEVKRKAQRFCSVNCRVYGNRWEKGEYKTPFKMGLKSNVTDLLAKTKAVNSRYEDGNYVCEHIIRCIELRHLDKISSSDMKYVLKKWDLIQKNIKNG